MGLTMDEIGRFSQKAQAQILQKVQEAQAQILQKVQAQQAAQKAVQETEKTAKPKKGNKLHAEKVDLTLPDGTPMHFDSKREARRYMDLWLMQRAGEISGLRTQVKYELIPKQEHKDGTKEKSIEYVADFVYEQGGETVVEDSKGFRDTSSAAYRVFVMKRKMMLYFHGITVREV